MRIISLGENLVINKCPSSKVRDVRIEHSKVKSRVVNEPKSELEVGAQLELF